MGSAALLAPFGVWYTQLEFGYPITVKHRRGLSPLTPVAPVCNLRRNGENSFGLWRVRLPPILEARRRCWWAVFRCLSAFLLNDSTFSFITFTAFSVTFFFLIALMKAFSLCSMASSAFFASVSASSRSSQALVNTFLMYAFRLQAGWLLFTRFHLQRNSTSVSGESATSSR